MYLSLNAILQHAQQARFLRAIRALDQHPSVEVRTLKPSHPRRTLHRKMDLSDFLDQGLEALRCPFALLLSAGTGDINLSRGAVFLAVAFVRRFLDLGILVGHTPNN